MRWIAFFINRMIGIACALVAVVAASYAVLFFEPNGTYTSLLENGSQQIVRQFLQSLFKLEKSMFTFHFQVPLDRLMPAFEISAFLALGSIAIAAIIGIPLGILAAVKKNSWFAHLGGFGGLIAQGVPPYTLAIVLQLCLAIFWPILPLDGWTSPLCAVLPILTLAASSIGYMIKFMQVGMNQQLAEGYVLSAKARGLSGWKIVTRHALRPALMTLVTFFGPQTAILITSTVVIEQVFSIPGMSRMFGAGLMAGGVGMPMGNGDPTLGVTSLFILAILIMLLNLIVDCLYQLLNPRVRA